jgi:hypothetical protein
MLPGGVKNSTEHRANTAPVAFGGIGIPIIVAGQVSGVDTFAISQMVGRTLPFLSLIIPFYIVVLMSGWKKGLEVWPGGFGERGLFGRGHGRLWFGGPGKRNIPVYHQTFAYSLPGGRHYGLSAIVCFYRDDTPLK